MTSLTDFDPRTLIDSGFCALGKRYLLWRTFPPRRDGGKPAKLPCSTMGRPIDGTDERRWLEFDVAVRFARRSGFGLGVALGWGLGGLDLDDCLNGNGELNAAASTILRHFPTYVEISPSGTGVKAYFVAGPTFTTTAKRDDRNIELYAGRRFFALTGRPLEGTVVPIGDCTSAATTLATVLRPPPPPRPPRPPAPPARDALQRLRDCQAVRERPSIYGGTVVALRRCPFTDEEHPGGGSFAIVFTDGGIYFRCDRSVHGPQRQWVAP